MEPPPLNRTRGGESPLVGAPAFPPTQASLTWFEQGFNLLCPRCSWCFIRWSSSRLTGKQKPQDQGQLKLKCVFRLIARNRIEDAALALKKLRKKNTPEASIHEEIGFLSHIQGNEGKGSWKEVFSGNNRVSPILYFTLFLITD